MISCSVSVSDEKTAMSVKAVLELCGIPHENGDILVTDSADADTDGYAGAVILSRSRIAPDEREGVRVLSVPFGYTELISVLNGLEHEHKDISVEVSALRDDSCVEIRDGVVRWQGKSVQLTERELMLFEYLKSRRGQVVTRDELMTEVWSDADSGTNVSDVYISYLRKKLTPVFGRGVLLTVRGQGYILNLPG